MEQVKAYKSAGGVLKEVDDTTRTVQAYKCADGVLVEDREVALAHDRELAIKAVLNKWVRQHDFREMYTNQIVDALYGAWPGLAALICEARDGVDKQYKDA